MENINIQVGDVVKAISPCDNKVSVQYEIGKVIYVGRRVLVEFLSNVCGHDGNGLGKRGYCWMMDEKCLVGMGVNVMGKIK